MSWNPLFKGKMYQILRSDIPSISTDLPFFNPKLGSWTDLTTPQAFKTRTHSPLNLASWTRHQTLPLKTLRCGSFSSPPPLTLSDSFFSLSRRSSFCFFACRRFSSLEIAKPDHDRYDNFSAYGPSCEVIVTDFQRHTSKLENSEHWLTAILWFCQHK